MTEEFSLLDRLPIGAFSVTADLTVRYWNLCMEDWTGLPSPDIVGKPLTSFFPAFLERGYAARLASVFWQGTPVILTNRLHGNLFPNRDRACIDRVYHTTIMRLEGAEPMALFTLENHTEVSNRIREAREELGLRIETEKRLRAALDEKDILFKEIHHRVKNNLNSIVSLMHLQMDSIDDEPTKARLMDLEARIQSFSLLHETLYRKEVFDRLDAADYLSAVIERLGESSASPGDDITTDFRSVELPVKSALYLGLALVELFTNAMKYGRSADGSATIRLSLAPTAAGRYRLTVLDGGPGIREGESSGSEDSLGVKLIRMMAGELGGTIRYEAPPGGGTLAALDFSTGSA